MKSKTHPIIAFLASVCLAVPAWPQGTLSDPHTVPAEAADAPLKGEEVAVLTDAPNVPPPITRSHPTNVKV